MKQETLHLEEVTIFKHSDCLQRPEALLFVKKTQYIRPKTCILGLKVEMIRSQDRVIQKSVASELR